MNEERYQGLGFKVFYVRPAPCPVPLGVLRPQMIRNAPSEYDGSFKEVRKHFSIFNTRLFGQGKEKAGLLKGAAGKAALTFHGLTPLSLS
jgi:hypothetical protein